ncbi:MAG: DNA mismatch repair protein MutS, partial [Oscillospiraceae bacterium]
MADFSPMMRQYLEIKSRNKENIVFFRVGDFYEMFYDDAILASKELELTLTGKECGQEERAPMCGVPHHSAEAYIARLIEKGYKVAIAEQVEDPATAKGLVEREVVRVVTPGTVIENTMLQDDRNNYLGSIYMEAGTAGVCFADISTGKAYTACFEGDDAVKLVLADLARFSPSELLFNSEVLKYRQVTDFVKSRLTCTVELLDDSEFSKANAMGHLAEQFGDALEASVDVKRDVPGLQALGALLSYLAITQKKGVERLKSVEQYSPAQYMHLSPITRVNLELTETARGREKKGTLLWVLDQTTTAMGRRLMRTWLDQPLMDAGAINARLDGVEELVGDNVRRLELSEALAGVFDMERLMTRVVYGSATPRDVAALGVTCERLPGIRALLEGCTCSELAQLRAGVDPLQDLHVLITNTLAEALPAKLGEGGVIRSGFDAEVDELRDTVSGGKGMLAAVESKLKEETGIRTLK